MKPVLAKLTGGDRRTVRGVEEVVAMVTVDPALFGDLVEGMLADNPLIRMRVAQFFLRLPLSLAERRAAVKLLNGYLGDESRIVKTFSMQALADIAGQDSRLRPAIVRQLEQLTRTRSPAMKSRGRRLLAKLRR